MKNFYIIFTTIIVLCTARTSDWSYSGEHGPTYWPGLCVTGKKQSPINIVTEDTINTDIGELKFIRYDFAFECKITNNGHSVQLQLSGVPVHLEGANLESTYILEQIHFHWPAEHTVDNNRDALELHFVHYKEQYGNTSAASKHENGIAVVATLFELDSEDNMEIMPILKATELISNGIGKSTELNESKFIPSLFLPKDHTTYYHYDGSLTTPGCQETVMWYILTEKLSVSEQQEISMFQEELRISNVKIKRLDSSLFSLLPFLCFYQNIYENIIREQELLYRLIREKKKRSETYCIQNN
ncbi:carbonic anhydrase 6-like isoform X3 [Apis cerana]|uniref:carbonic anhydrase 6-like isoform X3 n=1 Tax=Apis cerana TaxID=7461 RepID=UPI00109BA316|nr:carbonic anhydrase 6-like isoform X3 [Apis cerana]